MSGPIKKSIDVPTSHTLYWVQDNDENKKRPVSKSDLADLRFYSADEMYDTTERMFHMMGIEMVKEDGPSMLRWLIGNVAQYNGSILDAPDWMDGVAEFVEYLRAYAPAPEDGDTP